MQGLDMLKICFWNCQGYPWQKGAGLGPAVGDADVIFLAETWEHETCRLPPHQDFETHSAWLPKKASCRRGNGGVACLFRKALHAHMHIHKVDPHKRYIWLKILSVTQCPLYVAGCYIPHFDSTYYADATPSRDDPFRDLELDVAAFMQEGNVMILGDLNARVGNFQIGGEQDILYPWHREPDAKDMGWDRESQDVNHGLDSHGKCLSRMCGSTNLLIVNGMPKWRSTGAFSCFTNTGSSLIDYLLVQDKCIDLVKHFALTELQPESDHRPLMLHLMWEKPPILQPAIKPHSSRFRLNASKASQYSKKVQSKLQSLCIPVGLKHSWETFLGVITECADACFSQQQKRAKQHTHRTFPTNKWYDQECNQARAKVMTAKNLEERKEADKLRKTLNRRKKRTYEVTRNENKCTQLATRPKAFWMDTRILENDSLESIDMEQMFSHVKGLYELANAQAMPQGDNLGMPATLFHLDDIKQGLKTMSNGKAADLQMLQAELFKWAGEEAHTWICHMLNQALKEGFHSHWTENWIMPLHKGGEKDKPGNYRTIMVSSTMAKLFGTIMQDKISSWAETHFKRARGQAGFRRRHSTIDHIVTLRVLMEESRLRGEALICCFVDFKKAFDTIPRLSLWERMQHLGVPIEYRQAVARLYEKVCCQVRMKGNISEIFHSNIGVKQGCPLSPTLFGLCIDELEGLVQECISMEGITEPKIGAYAITLLLYADDIVLLAKTQEEAQKLMLMLESFCKKSGLQVNTDKTKIMLVKTHKDTQPTIVYQQKTLEVVDSFKYLGINIPSNHRWHGCVEKRIEAGWKSYYAFENTCKRAEISSWKLRKYLFDALVTPVVLYGVEVWGGSASKSAWTEVEKIQKHFITSFLGVKRTTPYNILLLETGSLPLELLGMERMSQYLAKVSKLPEWRLPHLAWTASCKRQKTIKSKTLMSGWMEDTSKWFRRWDATTLLVNPISDGRVVEAFLRRQLLASWEQAIHRTRFEYYTHTINPMFKDFFFAPQGQHTQPYLLEPVPRYTMRTVASIRTSSHHLRCETARWHDKGGTPTCHSHKICLLCSKDQIESEQHVLLECNAYSHVRQSFTQIVAGHTNIANFFSQKGHTLAMGAYIAKVMETRRQLLDLKGLQDL